MKKCKKEYDFTGLACEITGDALYLINGGKEIGNSYAEQAEAKPGDTVTDSKGVTHELTQGDINWAKQKISGQDNTSQPAVNAGTANNSGGNHNSENQNQDRDLRVTPANYQDPATDARGYYSTGANYTESNGSDNDYGMAVIPFKDRRSKLFSHGKSAGKVITDWNEYAEKVNLEKEEYMKEHLYDGFDIEDNVQKTQVAYQVCTNLKDFHCDIIAWNEAIDRGVDPRGQKGEIPDLNGINVDTMYDLFTYNRQQGSPEEYTEGYGFYDGTPDKIDNPTHIEFYSYDSGDTFIKYTTDGITTPVPEQRRIDDSRNNNWTFIALPKL